jgi:hypothetical protein
LKTGQAALGLNYEGCSRRACENHELRSNRDSQPDRSSWHCCPLTLKGNGGGILGHNFEDKCRESHEWQTILMVVRRIQLTRHQPATRKTQAMRQTTLYVPLSIFGCLRPVLSGDDVHNLLHFVHKLLRLAPRSQNVCTSFTNCLQTVCGWQKTSKIHVPNHPRHSLTS